MKKIPLFVSLLVCLLVGCGGNRIDSKLGELEKKAPATDVAGAKNLLGEVNNFLRWLESGQREKPSPAQLDRARTLRNKRAIELTKIAGEGVFESIKNALGELVGVAGATGAKGGTTVKVGEILDKALEKAGKVRDSVLGVNDPRFKKFGCPDTVVGADGQERPFNPLEEGTSRYCK